MQYLCAQFILEFLKSQNFGSVEILYNKKCTNMLVENDKFGYFYAMYKINKKEMREKL